MFSKKLVWSVIALMLLPVLAACGAETPASTPVPTAVATTAPATAAPAATTAPTAMAATAMPATTVPATSVVTATAAVVNQTLTSTETMYAAVDCTYGGLMKSIEATDDTTVKFTLCAPDPAFPSKIAFTSLGIHSAKQLQAEGGKPLEKSLGSGPYMVQEWVRGDHLTLVANPHYWGDAPKTKTVIFKWNKEAASRLTTLKAGEADGIDNPDPNDFASASSDANLKLIPREALNVMYVGLNNTKAPLDNEKVRQAIAMGINRQAIVDKFYPTGSQVASHFTPCAIPGGCEGSEWYKFDLDAAKKLLAESGVTLPIKMKLAYRDVVRGYLPTPGKVAEEIQAQLKALGIELTIDVQPSGTFLDNASKGNVEIFLLGWGADYPDMTNFVDAHFGKGANESFGKKWDDITSKLTQAASLSDPEARKKLYGEANDLIRQHVPMVPVAHGGSAVVYSSKVENAHTGPLGNETFSVMSVPGKDTFVWIQNAEPLSLYCADETDGETIRACNQVFDSLLRYKVGGTEVEPNLAASYTPNTDLTEWTIKLRPGLKFSDDTALTAKDVVATYAAQWDAKHSLHVGNTGSFDYWTYLFTQFLNAPQPKP
jgi:peptide/nickel transport system substrate-binding protein